MPPSSLNGLLNWDYMGRVCDLNHKGPGRSRLFETIGNVKMFSISEKNLLTSSNADRVRTYFGLSAPVQRRLCAA